LQPLPPEENGLSIKQALNNIQEPPAIKDLMIALIGTQAPLPHNFLFFSAKEVHSTSVSDSTMQRFIYRIFRRKLHHS
jgi:hypothetical protein